MMERGTLAHARQSHDPLLRYRVLNYLQAKGEGHAGDIVRSIGCAGGGIHLALQRTEQAGWTISWLRGHRRYYGVTEMGQKALDEARQAIGA